MNENGAEGDLLFCGSELLSLPMVKKRIPIPDAHKKRELTKVDG